jgi:protein-S-isoprenylcysteine O-methyltransferase Ste14
MNLQRLRVPLGFVFALLYFLLARPIFGWWFFLGIVTASIGVGIRIWAAGHLRKWQKLAISGPYRFTRNPLYLGSSLIGSGFSIASNESFLLVLFLILFVTIYVPVMRREGKELLTLYGSDYKTYSQQAPLFFPKCTQGSGPTNRSTFSWRRVFANREHNAIIGCLTTILFLYLRLNH